MCKIIKINLTAEFIWMFLASIFPITVIHAQETNIIKGMQNGIFSEVMILQSEPLADPKKPPPQITTQTYSEKNLSRLAKSLIFVDSDPDKCEIIEMDVRSGEKKVLYQPKRCFPKLIVFSRTKFILVYHNKNPYVTRRKVTPVKNWQEGDQIVELTFEFSNRKSVLSASTKRVGDTDSPMAMGITLKVQDKDEIVIADRQSRASLMGRYLINYGYAQELYDLETGEVIRELFASSWVYE